MDYQQALDYIYGFINYETLPMSRDASHFDLRRMDEIMLRLGNPHLAAHSVHIAGTKGKGSTGAMIASVLNAAGYRTGLNTSPHLYELRERIKVDGIFITETELIAMVKKLRPDIEVVKEQAKYGELTTFEVLTALAFYYFREKGVDFQVMEVGLGGRLDATNIVHPEVAVITAISYDHTEVLGHTLTEIATQKAGIIKPGTVVVTSPQSAEAARVIEETTARCQSRLVCVGKDVGWRSKGWDLDKQLFEVNGRLGSYELAIPLLGRHQLENAATAVASLEVLAEKGFNISPDSMARGLEDVNWPGRFQLLNRYPFVVADGAHNLDSIQKLKESLEQYFGISAKRLLSGNAAGSRINRVDGAVLIIGASMDKEIGGVVLELYPIFDRVIVTRSQHPRAGETGALVKEFGKYGVDVLVTKSVPEALSLAMSLSGDNDLICITGSLFVVGEVIELREKDASTFQRNREERKK